MRNKVKGQVLKSIRKEREMNTSKNTFNKETKMTKNRMSTLEPLPPIDYPNLVKRFGNYLAKKGDTVSSVVIVDVWNKMLKETKK